VLLTKVPCGCGRRQDLDPERADRANPAAREEFLRKGYHGTTIASIARRAKVAPQTVYFVFHTKAAVISAVIDAAVLDEDPTPPEATSWWAAMRAAPDAATALQAFVHGVLPLLARASRVSEVLRVAAMTDDEARATFLRHERMQQAGYRAVIDLLAEKGRLRDGLTLGTATDILLTICGDTIYSLLTTDRGWSHQQVADQLGEAARLLLLGSPGQGSSGRPRRSK